MGQKLREDKIGALSHNAGIIAMTASGANPAWLTIGGQQYKVASNLLRTITADVTLAANTSYQVFAVIIAGTVQIRISSNNNSVGPSGFSAWRLLGSFLTNASAVFGTFNSPDVSFGFVSQGNANPVGMIVPSMLTEVQFQALNGTSWILADGRSVASSAYATITGITTAPDLRGQFLRGKNNGRGDGNQNPDGDVSLGATAGDAIRNLSMTGEFNGLNLNATGSGVMSKVAAAGANNNTWSGATGSRINFNYSASSQVPVANDNRPKNVTVNYFVKINY